MGIQFEKLKKNPNDRPIPVKQGRVRGTKIFLRLALLIVVTLSVCLCFQDQQPDERRILVPKESKNLFRVRPLNTCGTVFIIQTSMTIPLLIGD